MIRKSSILFLIFNGLLLGGCGHDDDEKGSAAPLSPPIGNISGTWYVTDTIDARNCGEGQYSESGSVYVAQSGNSVTVTINGSKFTGTLSGNSLSWSGNYPEDGGTTSLSLSATVGANCDTLSGGSTWSWSGPGGPCSGTTRTTAYRTYPNTGCGS
ncbi:MAG: hypothetical protein OEY52_08255 [Gammaproteobacteria bacterium]|nr:hypothetical protein [Gammaproteobacteria bacterium]